MEADGGGGGGRYRSRHGSGCDQSVHGGCDGAQMVSVSLGESHKQGHTKSHEVSQILSIEVAKRVVLWLLVVVVQGGRIVMVLISTNINTVFALRSSAGAVCVGHPYGTSERDSSCSIPTDDVNRAPSPLYETFS